METVQSDAFWRGVFERRGLIVTQHERQTAENSLYEKYVLQLYADKNIPFLSNMARKLIRSVNLLDIWWLAKGEDICIVMPCLKISRVPRDRYACACCDWQVDELSGSCWRYYHKDTTRLWHNVLLLSNNHRLTHIYSRCSTACSRRIKSCGHW